MCCNKTIEYTVIPSGSYAVLRGCAGCGRKARFESTEKFRVNANGGRLDVWLIYACAHCGHTYNLPIFERVRVSDLSPEQYARCLENDSALALEYGTNRSCFARARAETDGVPPFTLTGPNTRPLCGDRVHILNPHRLALRPDKLVAQLLGLSRTKLRVLEKSGALVFWPDGAGGFSFVCPEI